MQRITLVGGILVLALAAGGALYLRGGFHEHRSAGGDGTANAGIAIVSVTAEQADFPVRKRAIGFVESPATVTVKSRIDSQIVEQHVSDGQFVKAGELLFVLDDRDIKAQIAKDEAILARDEATHTRNLADLERYRQLFARNAGTQAQVDQATADERSSAASIQADQATLEADRLKLSYTRITAPIEGRIGAVMVTPGNLVGANGGTGLLTITQMKPLRVTFAMPESDLPTLQRALASQEPAPITVRLPGSDRAPIAGRLNFIDPSVDMASGTITAKAAFDNDDLALWPGQYVDVEIIPQVLKMVVVVPTVAVQTGQKGPYLFALKPDSTVDMRPITVALTDGDKTAVTAGVKAGEKVVVDGQLRLKQGSHVRERDPQAPDRIGPTPVAGEDRR